MSHHVEKNLLLWLPHLCHIIWKKMASSIFIIMWEAAVQRCFVKKVFLEISQSSQENTYSRVSFLITLQASLSTPLKTTESIWSKERPEALLKKRLWHRCFPVNFVKFLRTPFLQNTPGRLLLNFSPIAVIHYMLDFSRYCTSRLL